MALYCLYHQFHQFLHWPADYTLDGFLQSHLFICFLNRDQYKKYDHDVNEKLMKTKNKWKKRLPTAISGSLITLWMGSVWKIAANPSSNCSKNFQKTWNFKFTLCCMNLYKRPRPSYQELVAKLIFLLNYRSKLNQWNLLHYVKDEHVVSWTLK